MFRQDYVELARSIAQALPQAEHAAGLVVAEAEFFTYPRPEGSRFNRRGYELDSAVLELLEAAGIADIPKAMIGLETKLTYSMRVRPGRPTIAQALGIDLINHRLGIFAEGAPGLKAELNFLNNHSEVILEREHLKVLGFSNVPVMPFTYLEWSTDLAGRLGVSKLADFKTFEGEMVGSKD